MKDKLQIIGIIVILALTLSLVVAVEIKVQKNWDRYEAKVMRTIE